MDPDPHGAFGISPQDIRDALRSPTRAAIRHAGIQQPGNPGADRTSSPAPKTSAAGDRRRARPPSPERHCHVLAGPDHPPASLARPRAGGAPPGRQARPIRRYATPFPTSRRKRSTCGKGIARVAPTEQRAAPEASKPASPATTRHRRRQGQELILELIFATASGGAAGAFANAAASADRRARCADAGRHAVRLVGVGFTLNRYRVSR